MTNQTAAEVFLMVDYNNIPRTDDFWNIDIINTNALTFENSPILMKTICDIIVEKKNNGFTEIIFTNLPSHLRNKLYHVLSYLKLPFQKNRFTAQTKIQLDISNCFSIPRHFNGYSIRSPTKRQLLYDFYNTLNLDTNQRFQDINITSQQYITYCTIMNNYYGNNYYGDNYTNNYTDYNNINNNSNYCFINNNNSNIKMELSNLIFDIKDDITDIMFKNLMDKLAELKF